MTLSILLHVFLGGQDPVEAAEPTRERPASLDMDVLWVENTPASTPEPPPTMEPPPSVRPESPVPRTRRPSHPSSSSPASEGPGATENTTASSVSGPVPGEVAPASEEPSSPSIDVARLLPSAVARGTFGPRVVTIEMQEEALEAALEADLYQIANAANYDTVRPAPELRASGDGGYTYRGHLFDAHISPSGDVSFSDGSNFAFDGLGGPSNTVGLGFTFDISAAAERAAGNDPHAAERRWFMEETRRTRDRLAAAARARVQGRGLVRLRRQIQTIWESRERAGERRRQLFRVWDSCEEDEVGAVARAVILQFVREHPGPERAEVFSVEELRRLNASRISRETFAPY